MMITTAKQAEAGASVLRSIVYRMRMHGTAGQRVVKRWADEIEDAVDGLSAPAVSEVTQMADAAEMLWIVLANVSGGDWTKQSVEWQDTAARWRDNYFAALKARATPPVAERDNGTTQQPDGVRGSNVDGTTTG